MWIIACGEAGDPSGECSIGHTKDYGGGGRRCEMVRLLEQQALLVDAGHTQKKRAQDVF